MKKKDIISLVAMGIIVVIAYLGALFRSNGNHLDAVIGLLIILAPFALFYVFAVVARNKKGDYVKFWRGASYVSFGLSVILLLGFSSFFMHYFNVMTRVNESKKVYDEIKQEYVEAKIFETNVNLIIQDFKTMYSEYSNSVGDRANTCRSDLETMFNQHEYDKLKAILDQNNSGLSINKSSINQCVDTWLKSVTKNYNDNKNKISLNDFSEALIEDFKVFSAARDLGNLISTYNDHKHLLEKDFANPTALEKFNGVTAVFTFNNSENEWKDIQNIFTEREFNLLSFAIFLVLGVFACSSYVFFKDSTVRPPKKNTSHQDVYSLGHRL